MDDPLRSKVNRCPSRETVIVPSDTPIDGFTRTLNTVPTRTSSVEEVTSSTSVCHDGSFRTSET
jgi:hypothetical protein